MVGLILQWRAIMMSHLSILYRAVMVLSLTMCILLGSFGAVYAAPFDASMDEETPSTSKKQGAEQGDLKPTVKFDQPNLPEIGWLRKDGFGHLDLCHYSITQADIDQYQPSQSYVINQPGIYCLVEDIAVFDAPYSTDAIVIAADDVFLWFSGHTIRDQSGTGYMRPIRIDPGHRDIRISGGTIEGFAVGIYVYGLPTDPVQRVTIRDMHFIGRRALGITDDTHTVGIGAADLVDSSIADNSFDQCSTGIEIFDDAMGTIVHDNDIAHTGVGILAYRTHGLVIRGNRISHDVTLTNLSTGIWLNHGEYYDAEWTWGRNNIVEENVLIGLWWGIELSGPSLSTNTKGSDNVVRFNHIHGGSPSYVPAPDYQVPYYPEELRPGPFGIPGPHGIFVDQEENIAIHDNLIYSGPAIDYYYGIWLYSAHGSAPLVDTHNGQPALYNNETCGVAVPLTLPAGVSPSDVDGGNLWEACGGGPVQ
jgi:hypothetical protein